MTQEQVNIVATVDGVGLAEKQNTLASFSFSLRAKDESLEKSKRILEEKAGQTMRDLEELNMQLHSPIEQEIVNFKLEHRENGEKYAAGYSSVNQISFTAVVDEKLNDIFKRCLKIDPHMTAPFFSAKEEETEVLKEQAIQKAAEDLKSKLAKECSLLGVSQDKLKIHTWSFNYTGGVPAVGSVNAYGSMGATGPTGAQGAMGITSNNWIQAGQAVYSPAPQKLGTIYQEQIDAKIKLNPGMVSIRMTVRANYVWA